MIFNDQFEEAEKLLSNASVGIHFVGKDGTILWANDNELEVMHADETSYVGQSITEFHADDDVISDILKRLSAQEAINNYPARLKTLNGRIIYVLINSSVWFEDGEFKHTRCFTNPVNEEVYKIVKKTGPY